MVLTKSILLLAASAIYQVSAFNYNVTLSPENNICVEVLGDETDNNVYPVKCPAVCGQLDGNSEFNAGQCSGTTGTEVYAHVNSENNVDYMRISNQFNYRFPCQGQDTTSSPKTYLCQGWLDPPSTATSSATSFATFSSVQSSATESSFLTTASSEATSSVSTTTSISTVIPSSTSSASSEAPTSVIATATSSFATASSSSAIPSSSSSCIEGSKGKRLGDGYRGYCCSHNDDCYNRCKRGVCNGPLAPPASPTVTPTNCNKGTEGKKEGNGLEGDCCYSSADCKEKCVNGTCNAPPS